LFSFVYGIKGGYWGREGKERGGTKGEGKGKANANSKAKSKGKGNGKGKGKGNGESYVSEVWGHMTLGTKLAAKEHFLH
jgi:hypothetical protein